jgi:uncharacterized protein (DUF1501 family)
MNRRDFLHRSAGFTGLGAAPLSTWMSLRGLSELAAADAGGSDYRALVCIFLTGGNDCFNMLLPRPNADPSDNWSGAKADGGGEAEWNAYCAKRGSVRVGAIHRGALGEAVLPLFDAKGALHHQALHGRMPRLQALFNGTPDKSHNVLPTGRHAAFVCNVGTVVEPVTAAEVRARSKILPLHLQSHANQIEQWQTCFPQGASGTGWAGRLIDELHAAQSHRYSLISLDGTNLALTGVHGRAFADTNGTDMVNRMTRGSVYQSRRALLQRMLDEPAAGGDHLLTQAYWKSLHDGIAFTHEYSRLVTGEPAPMITQQPTQGLADSLRRVAHIIKHMRTGALTRNSTGTYPTRQIFFVSFGTWDHHNGLADAHTRNLEVLDTALGEFYMQLRAQNDDRDLPPGTLKDVTAFTASDFGRALVPNGDGSDHAWGGHQIVLGGAVNGGQIYGRYPQMKIMADGTDDPANLDIYGNGVMVPTLSVDQYMQRLGTWFLKGTAGETWPHLSSAPATPEWSRILPNWSAVKGWNTQPADPHDLHHLLA